MRSAPKEFDACDFVKSARVFLWSAGSLLSVVIFAILAMPVEQLPNWLLWLVPLSPLINTLVFAIARWAQDNRKY